MRGICKGALLLGLIGLGTHYVEAQSLPESATMTPHSRSAAQNSKPASVTVASPEKRGASPHLMAQTGPPPDEKNRQDFEDNSGEKAGKLLLRSEPSGAEIFIDDLLVGRTPLLMVIAPGKYKIDMRGPRQESQHSTIGIMPKETQTVVVRLNQRYPATVGMH